MVTLPVPNQKNIGQRILACLRAHWFFLASLAVVAGVYLWYLITATRNVPVMDYWVLLANSIEPVLNGQLGWRDFFGSGSIHTNPMMWACFYANLYFFNYNTQIEIFAGWGVLVLIAVFLYAVYNRLLPQRSIAQRLLFLPVLVAVFNYNQWEITTLAFSFSFMLRLLAYYAIFYLADRCLRGASRKTLVCTAVLLCGSIVLLSQAYFAGLCAAVGLCLAWHLFLNRKTLRQQMLPVGVLLAAMLVGTAFYLLIIGAGGAGSGASTLGPLFASLFHLDFYKALLLYLGAGLVPAGTARGPLYLAGGILLVLYVSAVILYLRKKMYHTTYFPLLLILYTFASYPLLFASRVLSYGMDYITSSRYVLESNLGIVGLFFIFAFLATQQPTVRAAGKRSFPEMARLWALPLAACLLAGCGLLYSAAGEWRTAPNRQLYFTGLEQAMLHADTLTEEEYALFQAPAETVDAALLLMDKYDINVFADPAPVVTGVDPDGWVDGSLELEVDAGEEGRVAVHGYSPHPGQRTFTVSIAGEPDQHYLIPGMAAFSLEFPVIPGERAIIMITCDEVVSPDPGDIRTGLLFVFQDVQVY